MWALRRIAGVTKIKADGTQSTNLSRASIELMARDACDQLGWTYDRKMMAEYLALFGPDDRPQLPRPTQSEAMHAKQHRFTYRRDHEKAASA
jgi:hypothetical protein